MRKPGSVEIASTAPRPSGRVVQLSTDTVVNAARNQDLANAMTVTVSDIEVSCAINGHTRRDVQSGRHNTARSRSVNLDDKAIFTTDIDGARRIYRYAIRPKNTGNGSDDSVGPNLANA